MAKIIEFETHEAFFELNDNHPEPIKTNIPEWFKKLEHNYSNKTVKGCMPFLDALTAGYLIRMPQDLYIEHNIEKDGKRGTYMKWALEEKLHHLDITRLNLNTNRVDVHPTKQLEGSPLIEKNKNLFFLKIYNPWRIKTPSGYSCIIMPPLNNKDDRFEIISGIVDTDMYPREINFPFVINGDKYPVLKDTIKKGTPLAQIIPFRREEWKSVVKGTNKIAPKNYLKDALTMIRGYQSVFWNKKKWN